MSLTLSFYSLSRFRLLCSSVLFVYLAFSNIHYLVNWIGCWETKQQLLQITHKLLRNGTWIVVYTLHNNINHISLDSFFAFYHSSILLVAALDYVDQKSIAEENAISKFCNKFKSTDERTHTYTSTYIHVYSLIKITKNVFFNKTDFFCQCSVQFVL